MQKTRLYPVSLRLEGQRCLVVGGGAVAERKVGTLMKCGAEVTVVSPQASAALNEAAAQGEIALCRRTFQTGDLEGVTLVVAATDDRDLNREVAGLCRKRGVLVNVVDAPELCTFLVPAQVNRGPVNISISTGGNSPLLSRRIREHLERELVPELGELAELLGELRKILQKRCGEQKKRQQLLESLLPPGVISEIRDGGMEMIRRRVESCISSLLE